MNVVRSVKRNILKGVLIANKLNRKKQNYKQTKEKIMPFFQHEETGGCVQTFFGNKPPSRRFYEITEKQYKTWLANQNCEQIKQEKTK